MSLNKLQKQIQRELKTNPKKAVMLALLAVTAAWFWFPLIFKSEPKQATVAAAPTAAPAPAAIPVGPAPPATAEARPRWQDQSKAIENDPQMKPTVVASAGGRNPFTIAEAKKKQHEEEQKHVEEEQKKVDLAEAERARAAQEKTPDELGLAVTSTLVGRKRSAIINGEVFHQGDELLADGISFLVTEIKHHGVVLERNGHKYELTVKGRSFGGHIGVHTAGNN